MEKHPNVEYVMLSEEQISARVKELAAQLDKLYDGRTPVIVCILKGSVLFFTDLIRNMKTTLTIDFMSVSSYGNGTKSTGELKIKKDLSTDITGRDVLIVEDIIDSGHTMKALTDMLKTRNPATLRIVTLLDKPSRRVAPIEADYTCFEIEDEFVIGYGLDYAEKYRDLPYVGILSRKVYE